MSKKGQIKKAIADSEREIAALEHKRERSQSALLHAMLMHEEPNPEDEQFFKVFSALIDEEREHLRSLYAELESLRKKK